MASLSIATLLSTVAGREDFLTSLNAATAARSAVGRVLDAAGNPIRQSDSPVQAYVDLGTPAFSTWDNSSTKSSAALSGTVGEAVAATAYTIVTYPVNYEDDIANFTRQFASRIADGFARYIDDRVLNTASIGVIPLASGVGNRKASTTSGATTYQLRTDLVDTMGLVISDGYDVNGIIGERGEVANVLNAVGTNGTPVFTTDANGGISTLLGQPYASTRVNLASGARFVVGDWTKMSVWMYKNLKITADPGATINGVSMFETNQIAVRAEARMLFVVSQPSAFAFLYS